jgi:circadian clock protein KaiB
VSTTETQQTEGEQRETLREFEDALSELGSAQYALTLFVAGASALSARALTAVRAICETHLQDRYELQVVDVHRNPGVMSSRGVLASPTLIKDHPLPRRVLVGDLSDTSRVLLALDIEPVAHSVAGAG